MPRPNWDNAKETWQLWQVSDIRKNDPMIVPCRNQDGNILSFDDRRDAVALFTNRSKTFPEGRYMIARLRDGKIDGFA